MKKLITIIILFIAFSINSQISNLSELASGKIQVFTPLTELDNSIYGYFMIVKLEDINKTTERFEYVLLDNNLNKVANGEFEDTRYKGYFSRFLSPEKVGNKVILSRIHSKTTSTYAYFITNRSLDIKSNKISTSFYYDNPTFIEGDRPQKKLRKALKKIKKIAVPIAAKDGFVLIENFKLKKNNKLPQFLKFYNSDKKEKWQHVVSKGGERINYFFNVIDENHLIYSENNESLKKRSYTIVSLNPLTGKELFRYEIENFSSKMNHSYMVKTLEDKIVIIGKISPYKRAGYDVKKAAGLFRITLDKNGKELSKKYFYWREASEFLPMKKNGKTKDGYRLYAKSYFVFKDGTISVLTEKRKDGYNIFLGSNTKTADFHILNFDEDFSITGIETIKKDISKWSYSDYLYSQEIKDGNGVVFFYNDYKKDAETKKKNWILGIVTILNGKMNHEQIPISSEEFFISPYIAKEGYILLREYNKDSDYDKIRLERLNY